MTKCLPTKNVDTGASVGAINTVQPAAETPSLRYAGFWIRVVAILIDGIIVGIVSAVVRAIMGLEIKPGEDSLGGSLVNTLISFGYFITMTYKYEATLGKKALGLKVVSAEEKPLSLGQVTLRETLGRLVAGITLLIGYIMVAFTQKKQGLHDMIAKTYVVYR